MIEQKVFDNPNAVHVEAAVAHRNPIVVEVSKGRKEDKLDVRHWYYNDEEEAYCRTRQGVQIKLEQTPELVAAILDAYNQSVPDDKKLALA